MRGKCWVGLLLLLWSGVSFADQPDGRRLRLLASIKPLALIAEAVAAGLPVDVEVLLPPGSSPHHYALKPSDARRLHEADLLLCLGGHAEPHLARARADNRVALLEILPQQDLIVSGPDVGHHGHDDHPMADPHIWLDPSLARQVAVQVAAALQQNLPGEQARLQANLKAFEVRTQDLEQKLQAKLIPLQNKGFLVHHDAYQYLFRRYGLAPLGVVIERPGEAGSSVSHMLGLQSQLRGRKTICFFREPQFQHTGQPRLGGDVQLLSATLDPLGTTARSYEEMLLDIAGNLEACLQGQP